VNAIVSVLQAVLRNRPANGTFGLGTGGLWAGAGPIWTMRPFRFASLPQAYIFVTDECTASELVGWESLARAARRASHGFAVLCFVGPPRNSAHDVFLVSYLSGGGLR
jgi:hypothetical protein